MFLIVLDSYAQSKNEREFKINLDKFPVEASSLISTIIDDVKRIRHFKEIDGTNDSYESKFKFKKHWYSVEFDSGGTLEDVEVTVRERHISETIKTKITSYLENSFDKYDFIKIQEQYVFDTTSDSEVFLKKLLDNRSELASNYEIIVATKTSKNWEIQEMTFDVNGLFLNSRPVEQDSYEYIMY